MRTDSHLRISTQSTAATSTPNTAATAVHNEVNAVSLGDDNLRADRDILTAAMTKNGSASEYTTADQNDYEMVVRAVQSNGYALQHASSMPQCLCNNVGQCVVKSSWCTTINKCMHKLQKPSLHAKYLCTIVHKCVHNCAQDCPTCYMT